MRRRQDDAIRITSASRPHSEDVRGRERRYLMSMGVRTVCFVLAVVTMGHWVMWVFVIGAVFLPYVAVVIANAGARTDPEPDDHRYDADRRSLPGGRTQP